MSQTNERPVRTAIKHLACGAVTQLDPGAAAALAKNPKAFAALRCVSCGRMFECVPAGVGATGAPAFVWEDDGTPVGA